MSDRLFIYCLINLHKYTNFSRKSAHPLCHTLFKMEKDRFLATSFWEIHTWVFRKSLFYFQIRDRDNSRKWGQTSAVKSYHVVERSFCQKRRRFFVTFGQLFDLKRWCVCVRLRFANNTSLFEEKNSIFLHVWKSV